MGSGSSKAKQPPNNPQPTLGSSSPPKGLPVKPGAGGVPAPKQTQHQTSVPAGTKTENGDKPSTRSESVRPENVDKPPTRGDSVRPENVDKPPTRGGSVRQHVQFGEEANTVVKRPLKSARSARLMSAAAKNRKKSMIRHLERGRMDDDDDQDLDDLIALGRADTRLELERLDTKLHMKREKSRLKDEPKEPKDNPSFRRFQSMTKKATQGGRKFEKPKTKLEEMYMGNMNVECPPTVKIVRIFTSSTFTDTKHERNMLMEEAYPKLKEFCQRLGYDFQVVDMRWGVRDEATDDHMTTEMCMKELRMCQKLSTGPNFVSLMSHKYGYTDFPSSIEATEFEFMMEHVESTEVAQLLKKWYIKDLNAQPVAYLALPISSNLPDFISNDEDKKNAARNKWWDESSMMQKTLQDIAIKLFDPEKARTYIRSVSETEIEEGILDAKNVDTACVWLRRTIDKIDNQPPSWTLAKYTECTINFPEDKVKKTKALLKDLEDNRMVKKLPKGRIIDYKVNWDPAEGINPDSDASHATYLKKFNSDFIDVLTEMIQTAVDRRKETDDTLVEELVQHTTFCQEKCAKFHGRADILKRVKSYMLGMSNEPLVLHGISGSGKTSIMAMVAKEAWKWCNNQAVVVLRFIGTTPNSSTIAGLLTSLTTQIRKAYQLSWAVSKDLRTLIDEFQLSLFLASSERPLVLILDSLDQLDVSNNARQLQWLPFKLRSNVKIIVSSLPEPQYECFPILQNSIKTVNNLVEVTALPIAEVSGIIDLALKAKHRLLTADQKDIVIKAFQKCPIPLFLKLSLDIACTWTSFAPKSTTVLEATVRASIDALFQRLEKLHGDILVSRALGYLTMARTGLTESELEDVISCDDDILNDVYMYWTPPVRRLPPLLLVRLRSDLNQYLVDRGTDNVRVMFWYHRQFLEAAKARYCQDPATQLHLHVALADFFGGTWAGIEKPFVNKEGQKGSSNRHVSSQPDKYGDSYNLRKLNNLPFHRSHAKQLDLLKKDCLCNFEFILNKLNATSLWQVMDDFQLAKTLYPEDELINGINDVLKLSQDGLLYDSNQLATHIVGRLDNTKNSETFLRECLAYPIPCLLPNKQILIRPGGQLLHQMAGHKATILSLDLSADGQTALTASEDGTIRLWNIQTGVQTRIHEGVGKVSRALFCNHDEYMLIALNKKLTFRSVKTGETICDLNSITDDDPSCLAGVDKTLAVVFKDSQAKVYNFQENFSVVTVDCDEEFVFSFPGMATGSKNFAAVTTSDQVYMTVFDIKKKTFSNMFRGFEPFQDKDLDETIQYEIDELTISVDEKHIVYSNCFSNDIVFLDFRAGKKTKVIPGNPNDFIRSLRCSLDGKYLYHVKGVVVNFYDINSGKATEELEHTAEIIGTSTNDMVNIVTISEDSNVRVWDRSKKQQKISQSPGISANRIRMATLHPNSRYIIGFGFKTKINDSQFIFVYDLMKNCTVRERILDCSILQFEMLNAKELLVRHDVEHKLKVVDIDSLAVTREFQGYLPARKSNFVLLNKSACKEVACFNHGRNGVKVYGAKTGKVAAIMQTKDSTQFDGLCASKTGAFIAAWREEGPVALFDVVKRAAMHVLKPNNASMTVDDIAFTPNGRFLLFTVCGTPPKASKKDGLEEVYVEVWDVQKGAKQCHLVDLEYYNRYQSDKDKSGNSSALDKFIITDDRTVLTSHDDFIIRVFEISSGSILHRLSGHSTGIELVYNPDSPYILSYGSWTEENAFRLWDKTNYTCVATFSLDRSVTQLKYSADGRFILAVTGKPSEIVLWKFHNFPGNLVIQDKDYSEIFKGQDLKGYLDLVPEDEEMKITADDPDEYQEDDLYDDDEDLWMSQPDDVYE